MGASASGRIRLSGFSVLLAAALVCAPRGACLEDLLGKGHVAGVRTREDKTRLNKLDSAGGIRFLYHESDCSLAFGITEGDLEDVEFYYRPPADAPLAGIIAMPRYPAGVAGWESQAAHLGLRVTGFAGLLFHGRLSQDLAPRLKRDVWPPFPEPLYTTDRPQVFVVIDEGKLTRVVREIKPLEAYPGEPGDPILQWLSDDDPEVLLTTFERIKQNIEYEKKAGTVSRQVEIQREILAKAVTPDVREYMGSASTESDAFQGRYDVVLSHVLGDASFSTRDVLALAAEYLDVYPEALRRSSRAAFRDDVVSAFARRLGAAAERAEADGRLATAAALLEALWRIENVRTPALEPVSIVAALDAGDRPMGRGRALAARVFFERATLPDPAPGLRPIAELAAERVALGPLETRFGLSLPRGDALLEAGARFSPPRLSFVEEPLQSTLTPRQFLKDTWTEATRSEPRTQSDLKRWEEARSFLVEQIRIEDELHKARLHWLEQPRSAYKDSFGNVPQASDIEWDRAQKKARERQQRSYEVRATDLQTRLAALDAQRPEPGTARTRDVSVAVRNRCQKWSGGIVRTVVIDPLGSADSVTHEASPELFDDCIESSEKSDLPPDFFYWTRERAPGEVARTTEAKFADDLRRALDARNRDAASSARATGDESEIAIERELTAALIAGGAWPKLPVAEVRAKGADPDPAEMRRPRRPRRMPEGYVSPRRRP